MERKSKCIIFHHQNSLVSDSWISGLSVLMQVLRRHGDVFERNSRGYYHAHGRADDTMNIGGIKVCIAPSGMWSPYWREAIVKLSLTCIWTLRKSILVNALEKDAGQVHPTILLDKLLEFTVFFMIWCWVFFYDFYVVERVVFVDILEFFHVWYLVPCRICQSS